LWKGAFEKAREHEQWPKFQEIARREQIHIPEASGSQTSTDHSGPDIGPQGLLDILEKIKTQTQNSKFGKSKNIQKLGDEFLSVLNAAKDVGASVARLNPYADLGWGILQSVVQVVLKSRAARKLCLDTLEPVDCLHQTVPNFPVHLSFARCCP
jgi:hypothetical protein